MTTFLSVQRKLLSLKERFQILDGMDQVVYDFSWRIDWRFFAPPWVLEREGQAVAVVRRKLLALRRTWTVQIEDDEPFIVANKLLSLRRCLYVQGGPFDGMELMGSFTDLSLEVRDAWDHVVADSQAKIFSLRDRHAVQIYGKGSALQIMVAILMVLVLLERVGEERGHDVLSRNGID